MPSISKSSLAFVAWTIFTAFPTVGWTQHSERQDVVIDDVSFSLPKGLSVEKVADQPLTKWPIVADWDDRGRLVIAESGGVSRPIQTHNNEGVHKIVRLVDENHDGTFDQRIVAADQLAFPEGVLCIGDDIFVSAPPVIWKLTDADQDGICEEREIWFDGKTITNCANDLHGPYLGRDGWIYWCKGAFGEQTHQLADGREFRSSAAHIYRRHPKSEFIEPIISGGMDNPVEMAFTPEGEKFFTSTFLQHPGGGLRDGIAHAIYGGLYGKDHRVIVGHIRTGPLMPITVQLGPAAPSGLISLESDQLVGPFKQSDHERFLSAASFNLHKVTAHRLIPEGAGFRTDDIDLLLTTQVDFHPTDVIEDADGSLLVLDTGGWYDLCCPTSRIDQKTAEGGIYRITSKQSRAHRRSNDPIDWTSLSPQEVVDLLSDKRPWVRRRAGRVLVELADVSVPPLTQILEDAQRNLDERLAAIWTLCQVGTDKALARAAQHLGSKHASLVRAACHIVSVHRYAPANAALLDLLEHPEPQIQRAAAEALGRIGDPRSVEPILEALDSDTLDRQRGHSLLYALIEINRTDSSIDLWRHATSDQRLLAAILVLEQLNRGETLKPDRLFDAAKSKHSPLQSAAVDAIAGHPEWASDSVTNLSGLWVRLESEPTMNELLAEILSGWRTEPVIQQLAGDWLKNAPNSTTVQQIFLAENLHRFSPHHLPAAWSIPLAVWMEQADAAVQQALAASLARVDLSDGNAEELTNRIIQLASANESLNLRLKLLASVPLNARISNQPAERDAVLAFLDRDGNLSELGSQVLLRCKLSQSQSIRLIDSLPDIPPQRLMTAIDAVHRTGIAPIEQKMLQQLRSLPAARSLPRGYLTNLYKGAEAPLRKLAAAITRELEKPTDDIEQAVENRLSQLSEGDPVRGLQVFRSQRAACSACHRMGYIGKEIGPDLTRIGRSRTASALLEAILYPSSRLEQSYQSTRVLTQDGQIYNGLVRSQNEDSIELQLNAERIILLSREDIESMELSNISVMPQGIEQILSNQELADLLALLRSAQ